MSEIVDAVPQTEATGKAPKTRSKFNMSFKNAQTMRFGEYTPHFVMECVNNDKINLRSAHNLRSMTLKAPLMGDILIKKDYFQVPMESILPLNWDKIYTNPVIGDDVPEDTNCVTGNSMNNFVSKTLKGISSLVDYYVTIPEGSETARNLPFALSLFCRLLNLYSQVFSEGSLPSNLGCHLSNKVFSLGDSQGTSENIDYIIDVFLSSLSDSISENLLNNGYQLVLRTSHLDDTSYVDNYVVPSSYIGGLSANNGDHFIIIRDLLSAFAEYAQADFLFPSTSTATFISEVRDLVFELNSVIYSYLNSSGSGLNQFRLNYGRCLAYQICCNHFYTNDKIDYVYSAELFRQYVKGIFGYLSQFGDIGAPFTSAKKLISDSFDYNGVPTYYDVFSGHNWKIMVDDLATDVLKTTTSKDNVDTYVALLSAYINSIFGFKRSLRFVDYFTSAKSQPLAVGDVNIAVNSGYVNAVDVTRNIQRQRFFNFVNKTGRRFEEYVSKLGGKYVAPDYHNPIFLAHTSDVAFGSEVENTGDSQMSEANSVTSTLRSNASKFAFDVDIDRPSILIGITYFDIPRFYGANIERQNFHVNRFDMFNPFMQYIGDQVIYRDELNAGFAHNSTFGYGLRHSEYKSRVNMASGGFIRNLPGWEFLADNSLPDGGVPNIGPDYIRSRPSELDVLYLSLTGFSPATYFHFVVVSDNQCEASRPMVYTPTIL